MIFDSDFFGRLVAGASGSAIAAWIAKATGFNLMMMFIGGLLAAIYIGPLAAEIFHLEKHQTGIGFTVGFFSIYIMRRFVMIIENMSGESFIRALLGSGREK